MSINLMLGDCLERMKEIPDKSVDMVLTDPPYGVTCKKWDSVINFELMWAEIKRVTKLNTTQILFGVEPFSSLLRMSNLDDFKYDWYWRKNLPTHFLHSKIRPLGIFEVASVFVSGPPKYYPQGLMSLNKKMTMPDCKSNNHFNTAGRPRLEYVQEFTNYPRNILEYKRDGKLHTSQKPVALLEYLIKTYTLEGETVLDFTMGSGSTGVACKNLNRNFIGIERDDKYFEIAKKRIEEA